ncbi:MAG: YkgJ family cysteine cluster protein [Candidatus Omnitrophota bacterium]|jgi:Fe-S-cluster containining protein|nr:MAG: YkgJ family cysteine cluster protein [Candidatus Omnitrophota bacterium]
MSEITKLKETILKEYPRLTLDDKLKFSCHCGLKCFNSCCADVNIFLTPYDVMRMRKHLGISSQEFIDEYTLLPIDRNQKYPVVVLKMSETETKRCPFVDETKGCTIYEDRPWACRMYPVGLASPKESEANAEEEFYFIMEEMPCEGFGEEQTWTIRQWIENQGIEPYNEMGTHYKDLVMHEKMENIPEFDPKKIEMFFMACYNLDTFRRFVFESRFLQKFEVDEDTQKRIRERDEELLKFGFEWLKFSLFGLPTMKIKSYVLEKKKIEMGLAV